MGSCVQEADILPLLVVDSTVIDCLAEHCQVAEYDRSNISIATEQMSREVINVLRFEAPPFETAHLSHEFVDHPNQLIHPQRLRIHPFG